MSAIHLQCVMFLFCFHQKPPLGIGYYSTTILVVHYTNSSTTETNTNPPLSTPVSSSSPFLPFPAPFYPLSTCLLPPHADLMAPWDMTDLLAVAAQLILSASHLQPQQIT